MRTSRRGAISHEMGHGRRKEIIEADNRSVSVLALTTTATETEMSIDLRKRRRRKTRTENVSGIVRVGMAVVLAVVAASAAEVEEVEVATEKAAVEMPVKTIEHLDNVWDFEAKRGGSHI